MSYNITAWRTKTLENFVIPIASLQNLKDIKITLKDNSVLIGGILKSFEIEGRLEQGKIYVSKITIYDEWGKTSWKEFLEVLKTSTGIFVTIKSKRVCKSGDRVTKITVQNGVVEEEEIEF